MNRLPLIAGAAALAGAAVLAVHCGNPPPPPVLPPAPPPVFVPPLFDAEKGEEILLRAPSGKKEWRWRVTSTTPTTVEVESQAYVNGEPSAKPVLESWPRNLNGVTDTPDLGLVVGSISRDHIEVAGQGWDCWCIYAKGPSQSRWYWVTEKLPVHGLLRLAVDTQGKGVPSPEQSIDYVPPR